jgi:hypothetical protein
MRSGWLETSGQSCTEKAKEIDDMAAWFGDRYTGVYGG